MKKSILFFATFLLSLATFAQLTQGINYQAVARDASNNVVASQAIGLRLSILSGSATGTAVYTETHQVTADANGIINLTIGQGTSANDFTTIDWGVASHFLKTEMDITGGANYVTMGTMQFATVPYALHAANVDALEARVTALEALFTVDLDGDGYTVAQGDCDDYDPTIYPGAPEDTQDGIDNDCDGFFDEDYVVIGTPAQVGDFRDGGVVFWVDPTDNTHGLVVAVSDLLVDGSVTQFEGGSWGCEGFEIPGADGSAIGDGKQNTLDIIEGCPENTLGNTTSAQLCVELTLNGFSDWFLFSKGELEEIINNRTVIEAAALGNGGSVLSNSYWTSTENSIFNAFSYDANEFSVDDKSNSKKVRAVRAF